LIAPVADWCVEAGLTERRAVLVGGGPNAERVIRGLDAAPDNDIRIVGIFDDRDDERSPPLVAGARKLGGVAELIAFARIAHIDMLIITLPLEAEKRILSLLGALWVLPVDIRLSAIAQDYDFRRRGGVGMIDVIRQPMRGGQRLRKRALDVVAASIAIVALSPVMLLTALAVKLDSPGPVFFRQKRHGYNDRVVEVLKFRSMRADACDPAARRVVTKGDPRVTRVGRFIRKTSIDELPQLFNVLKGDLSLVGPRPHVVGAVSSQAQTFADIVSGYSGRHRAPPGITGWAQINGWRGEIDDPEKLRKRFEHDLYYIENWSIWFDLYILAMTPIRLFRTENAY
ncbi:MAG: exopolysaccharide biosynthesis polyprenyl glycosylphosphotransferase, partial [Rubrimonas sp.]